MTAQQITSLENDAIPPTIVCFLSNNMYIFYLQVSNNLTTLEMLSFLYIKWFHLYHMLLIIIQISTIVFAFF